MSEPTLRDQLEAMRTNLSCVDDRLPAFLGGVLDRVAPGETPAARAPDDHLDIYVPGEWKCLKCDFVLSRTTLNVTTGEAGVSRADIFEGEPCPNDGTPMVKVTWRERASDHYEWGRKLMDDLLALTTARRRIAVARRRSS